MIRFALRKQDRIALKLGQDFLDLLLASLEMYGGKRDSIETLKIEEGKYDAIFVPSQAENSEMEFIFIVLEQSYDVIKVAYYKSIG